MAALTAKQHYWAEQLKLADSFKGSVAEYAHSQNIPVKKLYRWRNYFRKISASKDTTASVFKQVVSSSLPGPCLKLMQGNAQLEFARLPDPQWLAEFIAQSNTP